MKAALALLCAGLALGGPVSAQDDFWSDALQSGHASLLKGQLSEARESFEDIIASFEEDPPGDRPDVETVRLARQGMLELRMIRGEYADVHDTIEGLAEAEKKHPGYRILLARAVERRGRYEQALGLWKGLAAEQPGDLRTHYWVGRLLTEIGNREKGVAVWEDAVRGFGRSTDASALDLTYAGKILIRMGGRRNLEQASQYLVSAIKADSERPEARTELGLLYFAVYNEVAGKQSGERYLKKVLLGNGEYEDALVALYRIRRANFQLDPGKTGDFLDRALGLNPHSVPALEQRAIALLRDRRFGAAAEVLERALGVNPRDKRVLAHRATVAMLMHEPERERRLRERVLAVDKTFASLDQIVGDHLVALYRFEDAIPYYRRTLAASPDAVPALHGLAKALVYTGDGVEAAGILRRAVELQRGFVHPWRHNALAVEELLAEEYSEIEHDGFVFRIHREDEGVLVEYLLSAHSQARAVLGKKYGHVPDAPVTVEVFHTWDDFSVRTVGFRGFSALGACFGRFITLVSPVDDRVRRQDFMWAATVWHEYVHVLTLALSKHRVPRWLTEGFSVYEERQRNRTWERGMDRELFDAFHNQQVPPLRQLNGLFRGPRILFGYYQGGLIVDYLSREYGFGKVIELLEGYGEDRSTSELFASVFGLDTDEFDRRFLTYVKDVKLRGLRMVPRFSSASINRLKTRVTRDPDDLDAHVDLGWAFAQRGIAIDAANRVRIVLGIDPGHGRGLLLQAELLRQRKAMAEAERAYRQGFDAGADDFDSRVRYGQLLAERGEVDDAIEQFQRAKACWPQCTDRSMAPNLLLARLLRDNGREPEAMMELKAFVSRTGRAFEPRLELAAMELKNGDRAAEARLLQEAVWIDPFMRELHVRLGHAYEALDRREDALREFRVALAVPPQADRANMDRADGEIPDPSSPGERLIRAEICLRIAELQHALGQAESALEHLDRAESESPDSDAADRARELRRRWLK